MVVGFSCEGISMFTKLATEVEEKKVSCGYYISAHIVTQRGHEDRISVHAGQAAGSCVVCKYLRRHTGRSGIKPSSYKCKFHICFTV